MNDAAHNVIAPLPECDIHQKYQKAIGSQFVGFLMPFDPATRTGPSPSVGSLTDMTGSGRRDQGMESGEGGRMCRTTPLGLETEFKGQPRTPHVPPSGHEGRKWWDRELPGPPRGSPIHTKGLGKTGSPAPRQKYQKCRSILTPYFFPANKYRHVSIKNPTHPSSR